MPSPSAGLAGSEGAEGMEVSRRWRGLARVEVRRVAAARRRVVGCIMDDGILRFALLAIFTTPYEVYDCLKTSGCRTVM